MDPWQFIIFCSCRNSLTRFKPWALIQHLSALGVSTEYAFRWKIRQVESFRCLACTHYLMELILAKVFTLCCGPCNSPCIPIFKRFKAAWEVSYVVSSEDWKSYPAMNPSMKEYSGFSRHRPRLKKGIICRDQRWLPRTHWTDSGYSWKSAFNNSLESSWGQFTMNVGLI